MKNLTRHACALLCAFTCVLFSNFAYSQQSLSQINGWNAYVHLPANYSSTTKTYPTIIFFPGLGEVGTNANALISNGPGAYIAQGWNGNVVVDGNTVEFIVISIQPPSAYPGESSINDKIQKIKSLYRVDNNRLYLTGLSHGGWCSTTFVTGDAYGGPYTYASQIAAVVEVQGVVPDDNGPYPNLFDNFAQSGGRLLGLEQKLDNRGMPTRINRMNATKPGSGIYVQTNFGGGGHCCWNNFYGGQGVQPSNFLLDGVNQNIYQWLARQSKGGATPPANQAPVANAGADKTIVLPTSSLTLTGSGTDADGTIASYQWTKVSGNGGTIANTASASTNITGLTQGSYTFQLKVTDNIGATATDNVVVTVNAAANVAPTANAGSNQIITLPVSSVTLSGSGADADGNITAYQWTKISGGAATIANANSASTSVSGLAQGTYTFQLKVTDNAGASATANMNVTVNAAAGQNPPVAGCNNNAPVTHTIGQTAPGEIYRPNATAWKGGDTVKITGTSYSVIEFYNVAGDACRPIVIMPATTLTASVFRIKGNSRYLKIWGGKTKYGIAVKGSPIAITSSHHIEVDNIEVSGGSTGIYCKQDPVYTDQSTWNTNYRMTKFTFKNMWVHDIDGEGMYIGHTQPNGITVKSTWSGLDTVLLPIRLDSVEISNNIVERCTWDAIQLSNARNGNKIFGNTIRNFGTINKSSQQAGIILGGNTNGDVYNNNLSVGTGNGIQIFGYGVVNVYNNTLDSCGYDGATNTNGTQGQQSIYANDYLNGVESNPKQTINAYGNTINRPKTAGAIFITNYQNNSFASSVYNNKFCIPGAGADWQNTYLKLNVPGSTNTNNILSCGAAQQPSQANIPPVANAGTDVVISLPTATATLNGSGTDADGSITSYEWKKISGGTATIVAATNAATAVNSLVAGIYTFELTVKDNSGATAKDTVQVTVNAATVVNLLPAVNPANTVNGLDYKYYEGSWSLLPDFTTLPPVKASVVNNFDITVRNRNDQFGFSFTGYIHVPADAEYTFFTTSDDGSKLYIDGVQVVDNDGLHAAQEKSGVIGLKAGKHAINGVFFEQGGGEIFTVSYSSAAIAKQQVPAASLFRVNSLPVVNAGANQNITTGALTLSGSATDADGTIASYQWTKVSGADGISFGNANAASTTVTGLVHGNYVFQLNATDNNGASSTAGMQVNVNIAQVVGKTIRVNVFGGTNPHTDVKWNNWNLSAGVNSAAFLYEDRTSSTVKASITGDVMIVDNGTGYATTASTPAAAVLRYNSASTSQRDLTLKGLNPSKKYTIEFYASRKSTGNKSVYAVSNRTDTIDTDNNVNDFVRFTDISADAAGTVKVNISRVGVWNYLAGFSITEQTSVAARSAEPSTEVEQAVRQIIKGEDIVETGNNSVSVYPNPFQAAFKVQINNKTAGEFALKLTSQAGQVVYFKKLVKSTAPAVESINVSNLASGTYVLQIISVATGSTTVHKVIKN